MKILLKTAFETNVDSLADILNLVIPDTEDLEEVHMFANEVELQKEEVIACATVATILADGGFDDEVFDLEFSDHPDGLVVEISDKS